MEEIAIFPLNVVVFPGMPMPLHIFEERYKVMINECIEEKRPFGIVLIEKGVAEGDPNVVPRTIGCTVQIVQVERLDDGRMFLMTYGQRRFRLLSVDREKRPYLSGTVEYLDNAENGEIKEESLKELRQLVVEYLGYLQEAEEDMTFDYTQIPHEAEPLIYVGASLLNAENAKKQSILESNDMEKMLNYLLSNYRNEVRLLQMKPDNDIGVFSAN